MKSIQFFTLFSLLTSLSLASNSNNHNHNHRSHSRRFIKSIKQEPIITDSVNTNSLIEQVSNSNNEILEKRGQTYSGQATFFNPGLGSCGSYSSSSDFIVALDQSLYGDMGKVSSFCFKTITIYAAGKSHEAQIVDACPSENGGCQYGSLDMSPALFNYFSSPDAGVFQMTWSIGGNDTPAPAPSSSSYVYVAPTTSSSVYYKPSSTYVQPSSTPEPSKTPTSTPSTSDVVSTTIAPSTSSSISTSQANNTTIPITTTLTNSTTAALNSTLTSPHSPLVTGANSTSANLQMNGNLNSLSQVVLGLAGLIGASAREAKSQYA